MWNLANRAAIFHILLSPKRIIIMTIVKFKMGTGPGSWQSQSFDDYGQACAWADAKEAAGYQVRVI